MGCPLLVLNRDNVVIVFCVIRRGDIVVICDNVVIKYIQMYFASQEKDNSWKQKIAVNTIL